MGRNTLLGFASVVCVCNLSLCEGIQPKKDITEMTMWNPVNPNWESVGETSFVECTSSDDKPTEGAVQSTAGPTGNNNGTTTKPLDNSVKQADMAAFKKRMDDEVERLTTLSSKHDQAGVEMTAMLDADAIGCRQLHTLAQSYEGKSINTASINTAFIELWKLTATLPSGPTPAPASGSGQPAPAPAPTTSVGGTPAREPNLADLRGIQSDLVARMVIPHWKNKFSSELTEPACKPEWTRLQVSMMSGFQSKKENTGYKKPGDNETTKQKETRLLHEWRAVSAHQISRLREYAEASVKEAHKQQQQLKSPQQTLTPPQQQQQQEELDKLQDVLQYAQNISAMCAPVKTEKAQPDSGILSEFVFAFPEANV